MTNKVITQTVVVTGTVLPADVITKIAETKEFMVIDYPRLGVDCVQTAIGGIITDTTYKAIIHFNNDVVDASSFARSITQSGSLTFNNSYDYARGAQFSVFPSSGVTLEMPGSADFILPDNSTWTIDFTHQSDLNFAFGPYPVMGVGIGGENGNYGACDVRVLFSNPGGDPQLILATPSGNRAWHLTFTSGVGGYPAPQGTYNDSTMNQIKLSYDGSVIRAFVNGGLQANTELYTAPTWSSVTPKLYVYGGVPSRAIKMDEVVLRVGGTAVTASYTNPTAETSATSGGITGYTASKCIIPKKRVLEFV